MPACHLSATDNKSLDFVIFITLAKMLDTFSQNIIFKRRTAFHLRLVTDIIKKQKYNFLVRCCASDNLVYKVLASNADHEINTAPEFKLHIVVTVHLEQC